MERACFNDARDVRHAQIAPFDLENEENEDWHVDNETGVLHLQRNLANGEMFSR